MLNKSIPIILGLSCVSHLSQGQNNYMIKEFQGIYPRNTTVEPLGEILASGYLKNEINAYAFAWRDTVLKSKRVDLPNAPKWDKDQTYLIGDTVAFRDKYYAVEFAGKDWATEGIEPPSNIEEWMELSPDIPVSTGYRFPTLKDTLSKSVFLKRMVLRAPQSFSQWDSSITYYQADIVTFKGNNYECISTYVAGVSPENNDHWVRTSMGGMLFYLPRDLTKVTILFQYTIQNRDTVWNPQLVTVYLSGDVADSPIPVLHFYYQDVQNYLQGRFSPVFNVQSPGHAVAGMHLLTGDAKATALLAIREKLKSNQGPGKISIIDKRLYHRWLADTTTRYTPDQLTYSIVQDLGGKSIVIGKYYASNNQPLSTPFVRIPAADLAAWVAGSAPGAQYTFPGAVPSHKHLCCARPVSMDSVAPKFNNTPIKPVSATRYFFLDKYTARLDSGHNSSLAGAVPQLWKLLSEKYNNKALGQVSYINFYACTYDWRKVGTWKLEDVDYTFDSTFQLAGGSSPYRDYYDLQSPNAFVAFSVVYRKELTGAKWSFRPFQLTIYYGSSRSQEPGLNESFEVYWSDLVALLKNDTSKSIATFMKNIEDGKAEFMDSEVVYGLMGAQ
jgi:hypothetical protein